MVSVSGLEKDWRPDDAQVGGGLLVDDIPRLIERVELVATIGAPCQDMHIAMGSELAQIKECLQIINTTIIRHI